nr:Ger(x)C family spore germination protein [Shimazuella kribbensis]
MKLVSCLISLCLLLSGCGDQLYLERSDIILMLGIDLDKNNDLIFFASTPVFNTEVKKNYHVMKVKAKSLREARYQFNALSQGTIVKGKIQTILVGKKFLQQRNVLPYLDVIIRDPKDDLNSKIVMVDGPVEDIFNSKMDDKGRLGVVIRNMLDNLFLSGVIISPNLQQFNASQLEKRFTPMIPEMKTINKNVKITGSALLSHNGLYQTSLNLIENPLALILQDFLTNQIPVSLPISSSRIHEKKELSRLSIAIKGVRKKVKTNVINGQFHFDIHLTVFADLVERMFYLDTANHPTEIKKLIADQLNIEVTRLIKKTQKHKIDPIALGVFARAQQYKNWKKVEDNWFETFSKAKVNITTDIVLINTGVIH